MPAEEEEEKERFVWLASAAEQETLAVIAEVRNKSADRIGTGVQDEGRVQATCGREGLPWSSPEVGGSDLARRPPWSPAKARREARGEDGGGGSG